MYVVVVSGAVQPLKLDVHTLWAEMDVVVKLVLVKWDEMRVESEMVKSEPIHFRHHFSPTLLEIELYIGSQTHSQTHNPF